MCSIYKEYTVVKINVMIYYIIPNHSRQNLEMARAKLKHFKTYAAGNKMKE